MLLNSLYKNLHNYKVRINYDNSALNYVGRWVDHASGKQTGWLGSYIIFRAKNTSSITVNYIADIKNTTAIALVDYIPDNYYSEAYRYTDVNAGAIFNGNVNRVLPAINDGQWHIYKIHIISQYAEYLSKNAELIFTSLELDSGAEISSYGIGNTIIQCVGDSWMASLHDWPRLMDLSTYRPYQVSSGAMKCSDGDSQYNFDFNGVTNTSDPNASAVLVSYGVSDYSASVTVGAFETSLSSLVDKIRAKQPTAKIFLIRVPNNGSLLYGQYGTAMSNVSAAKSNCVYLNTSSLDSSLVWLADNVHLTGASKQVLADYVKTQLIANGI